MPLWALGLAALSGLGVFGLAWLIGTVFGAAVALALLSWLLGLVVFWGTSGHLDLERP